MIHTKFIGKGLIIEQTGRRTLVLSDLHLGYDESLRRSGVHVPSNVFRQTKEDLEHIIKAAGKIDRIVLLGDVKHLFGFILRDERNELHTILELIKRVTQDIIIIKGNHDKVLNVLVERYNLRVYDFYIDKEVCFLHGDRDFEEIYTKTISTWIVGHAHPAIRLIEGSKIEQYKCFLVGSYGRKKVIILPSFFSAHEGSDVCSYDLNLAWPLTIRKFDVYVVGPELEALAFGKVARLCT